MSTKTLNLKRNKNYLNGFTATDIGDDHLYTGIDTPMKPDAFKMSDIDKKKRIAILFEEIMDVMGLDLTDDSLKGTPQRVAKMYIDEIFSGLNPQNKPKVRSLKCCLKLQVWSKITNGPTQLRCSIELVSTQTIQTIEFLDFDVFCGSESV